MILTYIHWIPERPYVEQNLQCLFVLFSSQIKDGVAFVEFMAWMEDEVSQENLKTTNLSQRFSVNLCHICCCCCCFCCCYILFLFLTGTQGT